MDREQFIRVLESCIKSATGRRYPHIDWTKLSDRGLINCAEMVRDLLERRSDKAVTEVAVEPSHVH